MTDGYNENPLIDLVELSTRLVAVEDSPGESELRVELRVHPAQLDGPENCQFDVSLKRLTLSLNVTGIKTVPGSHYGEPTRENEQINERTLSTEISLENKTAGGSGYKLSVNPELTLKADIGHTAKKKSTVSTTEKERHRDVEARGNLRWLVSRPHWEDQILDAKFLNDQTLCKITFKDRANNRSIVLTAFAKQKELDVHTPPGFLRTINHRKNMKVLLSKALSLNSPFDGYITFSKSVISFED